jgi:citrate lyase subunit beta/citryl-CoA lyase
MHDAGRPSPHLHPRHVLLGAQGATGFLPVCDHYSGVEARMKKSLQLQADMAEEFGACVFDVTLDCEDGAPAGAEVDQAYRVASLAQSARATALAHPQNVRVRVGARLHAVDHPFFHSDADIVVGTAAAALAYIMVPKVESLADVEVAVAAIDAASKGLRPSPVPLHVLIESPAAVHQAFAIARHPRVQSISFGLMDFVSAHGGAIPSSAMGVRARSDNQTLDQFHHPLVLRAKLEIASACHAAGKVPSHCVVTEFRDGQALEQAARTAANALGYTRMWSIHPDQIRPILKAFSPDEAEVELASTIVLAAQAQEWAPISLAGKLHDRASFRYFWQVLERAHQTGSTLPNEVHCFFAPEFSSAAAVAAESFEKPFQLPKKE